MTAPEFRDVGDKDQLRNPPIWFLKELLERAVNLLDEARSGNRAVDFDERANRLRQIWEEIS